MLHDKLKVALKQAMVATNKERRSALRVVLGELARANKKEVPDEEVIKVLRKFQKDEKSVIGQGEYSVFLKTIEDYLPKQMSKDEIREYILTVDLSHFTHKIQAMGLLMKELKGKANGNDVRDVLMEI